MARENRHCDIPMCNHEIRRDLQGVIWIFHLQPAEMIAQIIIYLLPICHFEQECILHGKCFLVEFIAVQVREVKLYQ